jgi:fluoroquinolone transport system permease protein
MNILRCFLNDLRVQRRSGFWAVYGILCAAYLAGLLLAPGKAVSGILAVVLFADPCALGFYFVGGFAYLERDDGTFAALMTTPVDLSGASCSPRAFLHCLGARGLVRGRLASLLMGRLDGIDPVALTLGVGLGAAFFTLVGILPPRGFPP